MLLVATITEDWLNKECNLLEFFVLVSRLHASSLITALHCVDDVLKSSGKSQFFQDVRITKAVRYGRFCTFL